jgi:hypothetical protein
MKIKNLTQAHHNLIYAVLQGKQLQMYIGGILHWIDLNGDHDFGSLPIEFYRVKPESKYRPWTSNEVPVGARIRGIVNSNKEINGMIVFVHDYTFGYYDHTGLREKIIDEALDSLEHSTDGGKTWHPCGVLEQ